MNKKMIVDTVQKAADQVVKNWPLYSFVTSNPLSGLEDLHFEDAIQKMRNFLDMNGYPSADAFEQALGRGFINMEVLNKALLKKDISLSVEQSLQKMKELESQKSQNKNELDDVDRNLIKWLSVFLDEGSTEWPMPFREEGFYKSWKKIARHDKTIPDSHQIVNLPDTSLELVENELATVEESDAEQLFQRHLLALPGWTGYIKYRVESNSDWQQAYPVTLIDYLAVRFTLCKQFGIQLYKNHNAAGRSENGEDLIKAAWLSAMEITYQRKLSEKITNQEFSEDLEKMGRPDAQFVFCIDTRSERIRRAVENVGDYETFGYAGFFGIAMDYHHPERNISHKSCPPILNSQFEACEVSQPDQQQAAETFNYYNTLQNAFSTFCFTLKNNIPASFGYVESAGFFYGVGLMLRTLMPTKVYRWVEKVKRKKGIPEWFSKAELSNKSESGTDHTNQISLAQKTPITKSAFELMGWDTFAPVILFVGHGSQTANNPFESSLDCGACAGNKGRHNARILADICNEKEVRSELANHHDIHIPSDTLFIAAEHNTTSNHIELFDHHNNNAEMEMIHDLKERLKEAQHTANIEQFDISNMSGDSILKEAQRRTSDWAETRPEWGLAGNASFIIGPRSLTSNLNLEARSFLHSYDWRKDRDGVKLEAILQGPMVVTQWINNHYYFASVDNQIFGSGSKITQNVTGKFGVVQGNGGDLKSGLPLESLREDDYQLQHFPLRLSVFVHAPQSLVKSILSKYPHTLGRLVENKWIYLSVIDPTLGNNVVHLHHHSDILEPVLKEASVAG